MTHLSMSVADLVNKVDAGSWHMPEFQRPLKWGAEDAAGMLDSFVRDISLRQILVWQLQGEDKCFIRTHRDQDVVSAGAHLLVDGQQRVTVLTILMGRDLPEWVSSTDSKVKEIQSKTGYNVVSGEFTKYHVGKSTGSSWITARALLTASDDHIGEILKTALPSPAREGDFDAALARAVSVRSAIKSKFLAVEECAMDLETAIDAFERWNAGGVKLSQEDILKAVIAAYCPGLAHRKIDPFVNDMKGRLGTTDVLRGAIRTLLTYVNHRKGGAATSRLTKLDLTGTTPEDWEQAWADVEAAWRRVAAYLEQRNVHSSVITATNPLVPLVLFALKFTEMFKDESMLALYLLAVRTKRFKNQSTDAHMMDIETILDAKSGLHALAEMNEKIKARYAAEFDKSSPAFTAQELLDTPYNREPIELFLSVALQRRGAVDWRSGQPMTYAKKKERKKSPSHDVELHHVFPKALANKHGAKIGKWGSTPSEHQILDSVAAVALLEATTNNSYGDIAPATALAEVDDEHLAQQFWSGAKSIDSVESAMQAVRARAELLASPDGLNWFVTLLDSIVVPSDEELAAALDATKTSDGTSVVLDAHAAFDGDPTQSEALAKLLSTLGEAGFDPCDAQKLLAAVNTQAVLA